MVAEVETLIAMMLHPTSTAAINLTVEHSRQVTDIAILNSFQSLALASDIFTGVIITPKTANHHFVLLMKFKLYLIRLSASGINKAKPLAINATVAAI